MNEKAGAMCSVYHVEDRASAEARFAGEGFRDFVENTLQNRLEINYFDVAAVAVQVAGSAKPDRPASGWVPPAEKSTCDPNHVQISDQRRHCGA